MNNILAARFFIFVSRFVLGTVFLVASIDKIAHPEMFAEAVAAYQIIPYLLVNIVALIIPWLELLCGVFLIGGAFVRPSSLLLSGLLVVFITAMLLAMARNLKIDCGCFGSGYVSEVGWTKIVEDIGLLILGGHLFFFSGTGIPEENPSGELTSAKR